MSRTTPPVDDTAVADRLRKARRRIDRLATQDGRFAVQCKDTGASPEPITNRAFPSFEAAEAACEAARTYRESLRRLDPDLAAYDLVASERADDAVECSTVRKSTAKRRENGLPASRQTVTLAGDRCDEWLRIENGPVVHLTGRDSLLDDEFVSRQLQSKL
jgi:hypothetical protein